MVSRLPPPTDQERHRPNVTTSLGAMLLVLAAVLGVWFVNGGDPGTPTGTSDTTPSAGATGYVGGYEASSQPTGPTASASAPSSASDLPRVALASLPAEAADTVRLIDAGGPFPYDEDGGRFGNYEGLLPDRDSGYYAEYTVETPGSDDRGARRIIAGDDGELYWTADHYASFSRIDR